RFISSSRGYGATTCGLILSTRASALEECTVRPSRTHTAFQNYSEYFRHASGLFASITGTFNSSGVELGQRKRETRKRMTATIAHASITSSTNVRLAILSGGLIVGTLDLLQACFFFGWRIPLIIAAGLLGPQALHPGAVPYVLGVGLHFFIATTATA